MNTPKSRLIGLLVLIAGAILSLPQVAGASTAHRVVHQHVPRTMTHRSTTTTTTAHVVLIPPIVVFPPVVATHQTRVRKAAVARVDPPNVIVPSAVADPAAPLLPATGSSHVGIIALCGLCLIAMGLVVRRVAAAG
jgi:hypothetical protein